MTAPSMEAAFAAIGRAVDALTMNDPDIGATNISTEYAYQIGVGLIAAEDAASRAIGDAMSYALKNGIVPDRTGKPAGMGVAVLEHVEDMQKAVGAAVLELEATRRAMLFGAPAPAWVEDDAELIVRGEPPVDADMPEPDPQGHTFQHRVPACTVNVGDLLVTAGTKTAVTKVARTDEDRGVVIHVGMGRQVEFDDPDTLVQVVRGPAAVNGDRVLVTTS